MTREELASLQADFVASLDDSSAPAILPQGWFDAASADDLQRFSRYRSALLQHQERPLALTYPVIKALVGDEFFRTLAHAYGQRYPSRQADLKTFGAQFAVFLNDYSAVHAYPYFADVAALEWSVQCAAFAADAVALSAGELAALSSSQLDAQRLTLHPGCSLLHSDWPCAALWTAHVTPGQAFPDLQAKHRTTLVYRIGWVVKVRELNPCEAAGLICLSGGASLSEALLAAQARFAEANRSSRLIDSAALVTRWLNDALLVTVSV